MRKELRIKTFKEMHERLTDPEKRKEAKVEADRKKIKEEKKSDTGL